MTTSATPSGTISVAIPNADGSITNLTADLANCAVKTTPPPVVVQPPPPPPPPPPVNAEPAIPATAKVINMLTAAWKENHDAGTSGTSTGTTSYPVIAPDGTANCRLFDFTNQAGGGFIYHAQGLADSSAYTHFCYETDEYADDWSHITNAEKDMEHCDAAGKPLDMATQLDGYSGVVDVTEGHKWVGTGIKADPAKRSPKSHHTTRIFVSDAGGGVVSYDGITIDGTYYPIGVKAADVDSAVWSKNDLNVQLQYDTKSTAAVESKVWMSKFNAYCW